MQTATDLGYAEADPTADIGGYDAQQKAALLAQLAFHTAIDVDEVAREGITEVTLDQVEQARAAGYVIKLLAICERIPDHVVSVRVHPTLVPREHPLAAVHGANNAVFVEAAAAGSLMFYGAGAGGPETASAVLGDIVSAARRHGVGGPGVEESTHADLPMADPGVVPTSYHVSLQVKDEPGVLQQIAGVFSAENVSVEALNQSAPAHPEGESGLATLVIQTHRAQEAQLQRCVEQLGGLSVVDAVTGVIRVEES